MNEQFQQYITALVNADEKYEKTTETENSIVIQGMSDRVFIQYDYSDVLTNAVKKCHPEAFAMKETRSRERSGVISTMYTCVFPYEEKYLLTLYINLHQDEQLPKNFTVNVFAVGKTNLAYDYEKSRNLFLLELAPMMDAFKEAVLSLPKYRLLDVTGLMD